MSELTSTDYRLLAALRYEMGGSSRSMSRVARAAAVEPRQHQLLLALRGLPEDARPTIGTLAERLCVQHHTLVAQARRWSTHCRR